MSYFFLCHTHELTNLQARGFTIDSDQGSLELFIIKHDDQINVYRNHCPHLGIPLNWQPDDFMSLEGTHIQCATHGALFALEDGHCVAGPCRGQYLTALDYEHRDNDELWLKL